MKKTLQLLLVMFALTVASAQARATCTMSINVTFTPDSGSCPGQPITFFTSASFADSTFHTVVWSINDSVFATVSGFSFNGFNASTVTFPQVTTTYKIKAVDTVTGCRDSTFITVRVFPHTKAIITGLAPIYCSNASPVTLTGTPAGGFFSGTGVSGNMFFPGSATTGSPVTITYSVMDSNGCPTDTTATTNVPLPPEAEICFVTVDSNNHDKIVWSNTGIDSNAVDSFTVYRQVIGFEKIGEVTRHVTSFVDSTVNPKKSSHLYQIGTLDSCGVNSTSTIHQTILLQASLGVGTVVSLSWNAYMGNTVQQYHILRDKHGNGNWKLIDSVPSTVFAYTDINPPSSPNVRYRIDAVMDLPCATGSNSNNAHRIASADPIYPSSNAETINVATGIADVNAPQMQVYPNPVNDMLTVTLSQPAEGQLAITNVLGQKVIVLGIDKNEQSKKVDVSALPEGVYVLTITTANGVAVSKIIKNR